MQQAQGGGIVLRRAERKKAKMRLGITAPSGAGKTFSALMLARGIASSWDKVAVIDTETGSASLYSHLGEYLTAEIEAPFSPERYIQAIHACEAAGMEVIIIDSVSHEWDGKGGCLEIQEQLGGRYQDWAQVTPRHRAFLQAILQSPCHIITTTRRKQDYSMVTEGSKTKVQKVGLKEVQREGFEYELTIGFEVAADSHLARASKDRTGLFADRPAFIITEETGREILKWCESGAIDQEAEEKAATIDHIRATLAELGGNATEEWLIDTYYQGAPLISLRIEQLRSSAEQLDGILQRRRDKAAEVAATPPQTPPQAPPTAPAAAPTAPIEAPAPAAPETPAEAPKPDENGGVGSTTSEVVGAKPENPGVVQQAVEMLGGKVVPEEPKIEEPKQLRHDMNCPTHKGGMCGNGCIPVVA